MSLLAAVWTTFRDYYIPMSFWSIPVVVQELSFVLRKIQKVLCDCSGQELLCRRSGAPLPLLFRSCSAVVPELPYRYCSGAALSSVGGDLPSSGGGRLGKAGLLADLADESQQVQLQADLLRVVGDVEPGHAGLLQNHLLLAHLAISRQRETSVNTGQAEPSTDVRSNQTVNLGQSRIFG